MAAIEEAAAFVAQNPDKAAEAIHAEAKMPTENARAALNELTFDVRDFTADDQKSFDTIVDYLVDSKTVTQPPDLKAYLRPGFVG